MIDRLPAVSGPLAGESLAVVAWQSLGPERKAPSGVEALHAGKASGRCVYRLLHATENDEPVIAKRYRAAPNEVERLLYRDLLPLLPLSTPRYYGDVDAGDGFVWIFLQDVGSERFSPDDRDQQSLAAHWLGTLHAAAAELPVCNRLPHRGPPHYRARLEEGRRLIVQHLANPVLRPHDVTLLQSVLGLYETVERRWEALNEICAATPSTLVHGDFRPKNVYVRDGASGRQLLPIDWETAGWGAPAADLAPRRHQYVPQVDLDAYCRIVRKRWQGFNVTRALRLMWVGLIFRRLAAIKWAAVSLVRADVLEDVLARIRVYHQELNRALSDLSWGPRQ